MPIKYAHDSDIKLYRDSLKSYLPPELPDWSSFHIEAAKIINVDLQAWHRNQANIQGIDLDTYPFNPLYLSAGYHFSSNEYVIVPDKERVYVLPEHTAGGENKQIYQYIGLTMGIPVYLSTTDFSDSEDWQLVNNQLRMPGIYKCLSLIYEYLAGDKQDADGHDRQSKEYDEKYKTAFQKALDAGLGYDWNLDGVISDDEKVKPNRILTSNVIW